MIKWRVTSDFRTCLLLFAACLCGYGAASAFTAQSFAQSSIATAIQKGEFLAPEVISVFYEKRSMKPLWLRGRTSFQPRADAVLSILKESWTHGLNPGNYHVAKIEGLLKNDVISNRTELDMLLSDAVVRYASDMTTMRGAGSPGEDMRFWRRSLTPQEILQTIALDPEPVQKLKSLEPGNKLYGALRRELIALSEKNEGEQTPIRLAELLRPGTAHPEVLKIRNRFNPSAKKELSDVYDAALAEHIKALQKAAGLKADGIVGPATLAVLNKTDQERKLQIIANLERLRWINEKRPGRYILVNVPSASLWAVENGAVALEMPVIVGKTARPTYSFKAHITGIRFNPNWTVPPTIKKADFLPMLRQDPEVLSRRGIRLMVNGRQIEPGAVDWNTVGPRELAQVKMIQNPGDDNPLGKVRVIMENPYNIYLHDTNHPDLFQGSERALSSGCIRLSEPEKLANFILKPNQGWDDQKTKSAITSGRMRDIRTEQELPVYITYQTIWLDSQGALVYGRDLYGQDRILTDLIKKQNGIYFPQASDNQQISL